MPVLLCVRQDFSRGALLRSAHSSLLFLPLYCSSPATPNYPEVEGKPAAADSRLGWKMIPDPRGPCQIFPYAQPLPGQAAPRHFVELSQSQLKPPTDSDPLIPQGQTLAGWTHGIGRAAADQTRVREPFKTASTCVCSPETLRAA
ncbi:unnamed protein product [Natator depressus]